MYALESLFTVHFELYEASMCSAETAYTAPYDMCTKVDKNSLYSEHTGAKCTVLNALCCTGCLDLLGVHVQCIVHIGVCVHQSWLNILGVLVQCTLWEYVLYTMYITEHYVQLYLSMADMKIVWRISGSCLVSMQTKAFPKQKFMVIFFPT